MRVASRISGIGRHGKHICVGLKPNSDRGRAVSQLEAPFSWASAIECWFEGCWGVLV